MGPRNRQGKDAGQRRQGKAPGNPSGKPPQRQKNKESGKGGRQERDRKDTTTNNGSLAMQKKGSIPIPLQQLLLDVFRSAFLWSDSLSSESSLSYNIQTLKSHLYQRDFASAFKDANTDLLKAYALRWSAARALGYADIFWNAPEMLRQHEEPQEPRAAQRKAHAGRDHIVCIGGGAGAEVMALAAVRRALSDQTMPSEVSTGSGVESSDVTRGLSEIFLNETQSKSKVDVQQQDTEETGHSFPKLETGHDLPSSHPPPDLSITAVDIADWSPVLKELSKFICSKSVPSTKSNPSPLLPLASFGTEDSPFTVDFKHQNVLDLSEEEFKLLLVPSQTISSRTTLVTLMFTLNELFSTSMPKTVGFLLRLTDLVEPGTVLLVVDSPGSYSTVSLGATKASDSSSSNVISAPSQAPTKTEASSSRSQSLKEEQNSQRKYPMRFLLEHTLLSVASGKWERTVCDESRWFRRNQTALRYDLGDGIGLEDMRYQIHVYKKLP